MKRRTKIRIRNAFIKSMAALSSLTIFSVLAFDISEAHLHPLYIAALVFSGIYLILFGKANP